MNAREQALMAAVVAANPDHYWLGVVPAQCDMRQSGEDVYVRLSAMYDRPVASFKTLSAIGDFFGTDRVDVYGTDSRTGCETCDYGSDYGVTFIVRGVKL